MVRRISGGPQAVSGIGWALLEPIHWLTRGMVHEIENCLFGRVISVNISHLKWIVSCWIGDHADQRSSIYRSVDPPIADIAPHISHRRGSMPPSPLIALIVDYFNR